MSRIYKTGLNKEQMIEEIAKFPKFEKRRSAVGEEQGTEGGDFSEAHEWKAVTEEGDRVPLAFTKNGYVVAQFEDVWTKAIKDIPSFTGSIVYNDGYGFIEVFPDSEDLDVDGDRMGFVCVNSVNTHSGVLVKMVIEHGGRHITIPRKLAGFKRAHVGKVVEVTQDFLSLVGKVRTIWKTVIYEFTKTEVDRAYAESVLDEMEIKSKTIRKQLYEKIDRTAGMNLWDMFMFIVTHLEEKEYKSEVHRRKKLDLITEKMFKYAVMAKLLNA